MSSSPPTLLLTTAAATVAALGAYAYYTKSHSTSTTTTTTTTQTSSCPFASFKSTDGTKLTCPFSGASSKPTSTPSTSPYTHPNNPYANAKPMTKEQIAIVKSTAPVMAEHGVTITKHFYKRMFGKNPQLNNVFNSANQATGEQPRALAAAVAAYAANIDNLGALGDAVNKIAHKHCSLNITAEQYTIVGENLIASVAEVLGAAITPEIADAWVAAYAQLANILIGAEQKLYQDASKNEGGWNGWRKFVVHQKVKECNEITSFYLRSSDGKPLAKCQPGQYISVKIHVPSTGYDQPRQYSLTHLHATATEPELYRISVKREIQFKEHPAGVVSNLMHDTIHQGCEIDVSNPMGEFTLNTSTDAPVVLLSAGVGMAPMMSMLNYLVDTHSSRRILFVHGAHDRESDMMRSTIDLVTKQHSNITKHIFYEKVDPETTSEEDRICTHVGRIDLNTIKETLAPVLKTADFYVCGSHPFMKSERALLYEMGVEHSRIHTELFGTGANP